MSELTSIRQLLEKIVDEMKEIKENGIKLGRLDLSHNLPNIQYTDNDQIATIGDIKALFPSKNDYQQKKKLEQLPDFQKNIGMIGTNDELIRMNGDITKSYLGFSLPLDKVLYEIQRITDHTQDDYYSPDMINKEIVGFFKMICVHGSVP